MKAIAWAIIWATVTQTKYPEDPTSKAILAAIWFFVTAMFLTTVYGD